MLRDNWHSATLDDHSSRNCLGMAGKDVRPSDGVHCAEGNGQCIISRTVRGCSIHLQYDRDMRFTKGPKNKAFDGVIFPANAVDKLGLGIIPGCQSLGLPNFCYCSSESRGELTDGELGAVKEAMEVLGIGEAVKEKYGEYVKRSFGFSDFAGLVSPFVLVRGSIII